MAYSIDVYRGRVASERRLGLFALYIAFFPQLVAGPIERPAHLLPQLREHHDFDVERLRLGLMQMLWGFFQKVVIADNISLIVDTVYEQPEAYAPGALAVATYLFAIQIYCDFGGYSNIAIGAARILGIDLMENFDRPYLSQSIPEFWRRWHISLSTWFRDYVYIPLGGNRQRWVANIVVVFLLSGLWHGAAITFVVWGALHGAAMVVDNAWRARRAPTPHDSRFGRIWRVAITFHIVCAGWIFFRSESLADAWLIIGRLVAPLGVEASAWPSGIAPLTWVVAGGGAMLLMVLELTQGDVPWWRRLLVAPRGLRWTAYLLLSLAILNLGVSRSVPFMYFQF
jgi:D-alanyl-lipoteichoic acid acyltransferase DltB (MBOAT superfamily)